MERWRPTQQSSQIIDNRHNVVVIDYKMDVSNMYNVERAQKFRGWRLEDVPLMHVHVFWKPFRAWALRQADIETGALDFARKALRQSDNPDTNTHTHVISL